MYRKLIANGLIISCLGIQGGAAINSPNSTSSLEKIIEYFTPAEIITKNNLNEKLRLELLIMEEKDQNMLTGDNYNPSVILQNTSRLKEIIREFGWPTYNLVGEDGAHAAWLVIQHADNNPHFQEYCLALFEDAVKNKQASKQDLAYLTDQVLVNQGKEQLYGTQFYLNENGNFGPRPIKDEPNIDARRKEMDLLWSFNDYKSLMLERYNFKNN